MQTYYILANSKYRALAEIAVASLKRFSTRPCVVVELGENSPHVYGMVWHRTRWLVENISKLGGDGLCLLDADMVATPSIDSIWDYLVDPHFPLLPVHPHQHTHDRLNKLIREPMEKVYKYMTPSVWPAGSVWFARAMLNLMHHGFIDEEAANLITWGCGYTRRMPMLITQSCEPASWHTGAVFHGVKDPVEAGRLFEEVCRLTTPVNGC